MVGQRPEHVHRSGVLVDGSRGGQAQRVLAEGLLLDQLAASVPDFSYELRRGLHREPFEGDPDQPVVRTLLHHARSVLGHTPAVLAEPYWTDCALLDRAGIPCLLFGADGAGAHEALEWADIASLHRLTDILTDTVTDFCS
ncbi:M20/M25/M40 family metallo-hydrolase [Streptomyces sp. cg40]|uniref:M20/M25/M40 family metallo-hydrolase n=1 Tax=Streptomyces sp. cg40 TaxID=3419764 RepID=UPI003D0359AE